LLLANQERGDETGRTIVLRKVVFITQQVDPGHPVLAATIAKIAALAARVDEVAVLADGVVPGVLPANCRVHSFGAGTKAGRGARFERALVQELRPRPERVIAHMCPIYAVLAAPLVRPLGVPLVLWYTHWRAGPTLRLAERLSTSIVSVDTRSFPLPSKKVTGIGHGIDMGEFACADHHRPDDVLRAVALGRYSPAKGLDTVIRAVAQVPGVRLEVHGPAISVEEQQHRAELERLVADLQAPVELGETLPREELPALFARSDVLVNNMRAGAADKVVYEAAASCLPVLASSPNFDEFLDPFPREDAAELAKRLRAFAALPVEERAVIGRALREAVVTRHSVDSWADKVLTA
jgi:glycosyltransferase involved in cell wall biosynthesis